MIKSPAGHPTGKHEVRRRPSMELSEEEQAEGAPPSLPRRVPSLPHLQQLLLLDDGDYDSDSSHHSEKLDGSGDLEIQIPRRLPSANHLADLLGSDGESHDDYYISIDECDHNLGESCGLSYDTPVVSQDKVVCSTTASASIADEKSSVDLHSGSQSPKVPRRVPSNQGLVQTTRSQPEPPPPPPPNSIIGSPQETANTRLSSRSGESQPKRPERTPSGPYSLIPLKEAATRNDATSSRVGVTREKSVLPPESAPLPAYPRPAQSFESFSCHHSPSSLNGSFPPRNLKKDEKNQRRSLQTLATVPTSFDELVLSPGNSSAKQRPLTGRDLSYNVGTTSHPLDHERNVSYSSSMHRSNHQPCDSSSVSSLRLNEDRINAFMHDYYEDYASLAEIGKDCWEIFFDKYYHDSYRFVRPSGNPIEKMSLMNMFLTDVTVETVKLLSIDDVSILSCGRVAVAICTVEHHFTFKGNSNHDRAVISCIMEVIHGEIKVVHEHRTDGLTIPKETRWGS